MFRWLAALKDLSTSGESPQNHLSFLNLQVTQFSMISSPYGVLYHTTLLSSPKWSVSALQISPEPAIRPRSSAKSCPVHLQAPDQLPACTRHSVVSSREEAASQRYRYRGSIQAALGSFGPIFTRCPCAGRRASPWPRLSVSVALTEFRRTVRTSPPKGKAGIRLYRLALRCALIATLRYSSPRRPTSRTPAGSWQPRMLLGECACTYG